MPHDCDMFQNPSQEGGQPANPPNYANPMTLPIGATPRGTASCAGACSSLRNYLLNLAGPRPRNYNVDAFLCRLRQIDLNAVRLARR